MKIVNTLLGQASLMPLSPVIQPIIWSNSDALHLYPEPDFLILADDCEQNMISVPLKQTEKEKRDNVPKKSIHVLNPGSFSHNFEFGVINPEWEQNGENPVEICDLAAGEEK